ncbi:MAG: peptidoglycan/LPS O-acetylase OafA/YrhL [Pseudoalteromonas distincta]
MFRDQFPAAPHRERDVSLDVVRGLAIVLAMGWHLNASTGVAVIDALAAPGRVIGWAGVDLFFVLSGFLIGRLVLAEVERTGQFDTRRFLLRRAFRLWPVLYLYVAAQFIAGDKPWESFLFQNLFHVQNYWESSLKHLWSLAVEEHFYLILSLVLPLYAARRLAPSTLVWGLLAVLAVTLCLRAAAALAGVEAQDIQWQTHLRADSLASGLLLAIMSVYWPDAFARLQTMRLPLLAVMSAGVAFLWMVPKGTGLASTVGYTIAYITSACALLLVYKAPIAGAKWPWSKALAWLGIYSYSLYVWHLAGARIGAALLSRFGVTDPVAILAVKYAAAILLGVAVSRALEWPVMRLRDRFIPSGSRAIDAPTTGSTAA